MSKYIHHGDYGTNINQNKKWSLNWWANLADNQFGNSEKIGYTSRGDIRLW
jgi:hypothetical protein